MSRGCYDKEGNYYPSLSEIPNSSMPDGYWMVYCGCSAAEIETLCDRQGWLIPEERMTRSQLLCLESTLRRLNPTLLQTDHYKKLFRQED